MAAGAGLLGREWAWARTRFALPAEELDLLFAAPARLMLTAYDRLFRRLKARGFTGGGARVRLALADRLGLAGAAMAARLGGGGVTPGALHVVGAGVAGLAVALAGARRWTSVCLYDASPFVTANVPLRPRENLALAGDWLEDAWPCSLEAAVRSASRALALLEPERARGGVVQVRGSRRLNRPPLLVLLARTRGFCSGVERAIAAVEEALDVASPRAVHVRHEIVHNRRVVDGLAARGARFVPELDGIPDGGVTIFSAHGVSGAVEAEAARRGLTVIDATCPLVARVHREVRRRAPEGRFVVLIGHAGHPEAVGTLGRVGGPCALVATPADVAALPIPETTPVAYATQTTLSLDEARATIAALQARFPDLVGPDTRTICYATQNRQAAVRVLAERAERILVAGAGNSSNSRRLVEVAEAAGRPALLVAAPAEVPDPFLDGVRVLGLTAGASAPESLVQDLLAHLALARAVTDEEVGPAEAGARFTPCDLGRLSVASTSAK